MASWLVCLPPDQDIWVQALAGDIVLCSWAKYPTLRVRMSTQVYKWVLTNLNAGSTLACSCFMLKKPREINASLIGSYAYFAFHVFKVCPTILEMYW